MVNRHDHDGVCSEPVHDSVSLVDTFSYVLAFIFRYHSPDLRLIQG